ncbi:DMT family transporter [Pseudomonas indica]|uniref:DMT family transporter n=1 Tax=Pseudomonas indica TaxID=137658 RepID=UPI000BABAACC|nr:DMT family transporter [Pseudomonas indica]PAU56036.1 EamA family transporter [Pseudomonas indica]
MNELDRNAWAGYGSTSLFVLLWSSGAIFSKWGLAFASPFAFLEIRSAIALLGLLLLAPWLRLHLPAGRRERLYALATGAVLLGAYQIFYLLALELQVTPGVMATLLGVQPILTAICLERRLSPARWCGLGLGLGGLVLVVYERIGLAGLSWGGMLCGLMALASITLGSIMQKRIRENPLGTLPLQYLAGLLLCSVFVPFQPFRVDWSLGFLVAVGWMGLVISLLATLLLYRLIARGNLVNVSSLFYLVPAGTAILDYLVFGNRLAMLSLVGMGLIVLGLLFVFRTPTEERGKVAETA